MKKLQHKYKIEGWLYSKKNNRIIKKPIYMCQIHNKGLEKELKTK